MFGQDQPTAICWRCVSGIPEAQAAIEIATEENFAIRTIIDRCAPVLMAVPDPIASTTRYIPEPHGTIGTAAS